MSPLFVNGVFSAVLMLLLQTVEVSAYGDLGINILALLISLGFLVAFLLVVVALLVYMLWRQKKVHKEAIKQLSVKRISRPMSDAELKEVIRQSQTSTTPEASNAETMDIERETDQATNLPAQETARTNTFSVTASIVDHSRFSPSADCIKETDTSQDETVYDVPRRRHPNLTASDYDPSRVSDSEDCIREEDTSHDDVDYEVPVKRYPNDNPDTESTNSGHSNTHEEDTFESGELYDVESIDQETPRKESKDGKEVRDSGHGSGAGEDNHESSDVESVDQGVMPENYRVRSQQDVLNKDTDQRDSGNSSRLSEVNLENVPDVYDYPNPLGSAYADMELSLDSPNYFLQSAPDGETYTSMSNPIQKQLEENITDPIYVNHSDYIVIDDIYEEYDYNSPNSFA